MYVRITRFKPIEHWRDEVIKELDIYMEWIKIQPGFSFGMRLFPLHHPDEVARLTVWEDRS
jgi:heme-degrading monooxygenase HmoA